MISEIKGGLTAVPGFRVAGVNADLKKDGLDLLLLESEKGPVPATGLFTSNRVQAAPVQVSKTHLKNKKLAAIIANSGVANTFTGREGIRNARKMTQLTSDALGYQPENVGVASTGLIGPQIQIKKIEDGIEKAKKKLSNSWEAGTEAAKAIMTTDKVVKELAIKVELENGSEITIGGAAKGSGMIHPDLHATMIAIILTDANITPAGLRNSLQKAADQSFNMTTVDGDTSTNDTVFGLANYLAENEKITKKDTSENFQKGLNYITREFAKKIARDGEGATHLIEVQVEGAKNKEEAKKSARAVAGSDLVKTAVYGRDPNYGRIIAALGYSGAEFSPSRISISFLGKEKETPLILKGKPLSEDVLQETEDILKEEEIRT